MYRLAGFVEAPTSAGQGGPNPIDQLVNDTTSEVAWSGVVGGRPLAVSGGVWRVCGFTSDEILGTPGNIWIDRAHPGDVAQVEERFRLLVITGAPFDAEYRWQRQDGVWLWLRGRATLRPSAEAPIVDAVFVDITAQKRLEEQVRRLQKVQAIGQFTGGIAHDFNNLLAVILAHDTLLLDTMPAEDPHRADTEAIRDATLSAAALTKQLLTFIRQRAFEPRVLDITDVVAGAEKMLRRILPEDVGFSMHLLPGLGNVLADAGLIGQVLMNLVVNARDAMPEGGQLSIHTSRVTLGGPEPVPYVRLAVSDTGCGMAADTRRRVFEPFFTTKASGQGTGLGLSMCHGIVKQAGGSIHVDSEPGKGSVFEVLLPIVGGQIDAVERPLPVAPNEYAGHETLLLVEDDAGVRSMVQRMLCRLGYRVVAAGSGQEAIAILHSQTEPLDLVLCDVVLPDLSGTEIVSRVLARSPATRTLFMSGHTTHSLLQKGTIQEGHAFIQKPFMPSALARKVREVLDA